jgi:hypothetical protein
VIEGLSNVVEAFSGSKRMPPEFLKKCGYPPTNVFCAEMTFQAPFRFAMTCFKWLLSMSGAEAASVDS